MPYRNTLPSWAVIRLLPGMQRVVVRRFRNESDAEGHRQALCRLNPGAAFRVIFDVPQSLETLGRQRRVRSMDVKVGDLVRDLVPDLLRGEKQQCEVVSMTPEEYIGKLKDLLLKQAERVADAVSGELRTEVAELYDVLEQLLDANEIQDSVIEHERLWKRENFGGFDRRLKVLWIDSD